MTATFYTEPRPSPPPPRKAHKIALEQDETINTVFVLINGLYVFEIGPTGARRITGCDQHHIGAPVDHRGAIVMID